MNKAVAWTMENQKADQRKANPEPANRIRVEQAMQHQNRHKMLLVPSETELDDLHYLREL